MLFLIRADSTTGRRHELDVTTADQADARRRATRVAELLAIVDAQGRWVGSRVSVIEAVSGRLVFVRRILPRREGVRHG